MHLRQSHIVLPYIYYALCSFTFYAVYCGFSIKYTPLSSFSPNSTDIVLSGGAQRYAVIDIH